jgi:hypothetical protein
MTKFVPYLADEIIEGDAALLLAEYAHARGVTIEPPIPIEDIVEKHLKLRVEFDDTHKLFGIPRDPQCDTDILGAIFFDEARIVIDEGLDPEETRRWKAAIASRLPTRAVGIGVYVATCSPRTRRRAPCLAGRRLLRLFHRLRDGGKRQLVIRAGKSHKFTIPEDEVPH